MSMTMRVPSPLYGSPGHGHTRGVAGVDLKIVFISFMYFDVVSLNAS